MLVPALTFPVRGCDRVGGHHAGARVALRGTHRGSGPQLSGGIEQLRARLGEFAGRIPGRPDRRQQLGQPQVGPGLVGECVEGAEHLGVVAAAGDVDREHAAGVPDPDQLLSGELPVHVAGQGGEVPDPTDVVLTVQNRLEQVGDAPAVGDVVAERLAQLLGGLAGVGVPPRAERRQQRIVGVEREVAVHHGGHAERPHRGQLDAVAIAYVLSEGGVALLKAGPDRLQRVRPQTVHELVLPVVAADRDRRVVVGPDQHRLDPGRSQFDTEGRTGLGDRLDLRRHVAHRVLLLRSPGPDGSTPGSSGSGPRSRAGWSCRR